MDDSINVNKKDPQVRIKVKDISDKFNRSPYTYQLKKDMILSFKILFLKKW